MGLLKHAIVNVRPEVAVFLTLILIYARIVLVAKSSELQLSDSGSNTNTLKLMLA